MLKEKSVLAKGSKTQLAPGTSAGPSHASRDGAQTCLCQKACHDSPITGKQATDGKRYKGIFKRHRNFLLHRIWDFFRIAEYTHFPSFYFKILRFSGKRSAVAHQQKNINNGTVQRIITTLSLTKPLLFIIYSHFDRSRISQVSAGSVLAQVIDLSHMKLNRVSWDRCH